MRAHRDALLADSSLTGRQFCEAWGAAVDTWLAGLLGDEPDVALVAVGGHGRGELCPHSDLDLVMVHDGRDDIAAVADRIWYPIWDAGLALDHSVRTVKEAMAVAVGDIRVLLGLLDARLVAGSAELARAVTGAALHQWQRRSDHWLARMAEQVAARRETFGDLAHMLEPDLKESYGGLRDAAALRAATAAGHAPPQPDEVGKAVTELLAVRVELHRAQGRPGDRLTLEAQDQVAAALAGATEADADLLMARVASAGRVVAWASDEVWRRTSRRRPFWLSRPRDRTLADGVRLRAGEIVVEADRAGAAVASLRAAAAAADLGAPLAHGPLMGLAADHVPVPDPWTGELRSAFVDLLGRGHAAIDPIESLDAAGLWIRVLPEWEAVRSRPQRNAFHRFTVDRHLLETAARAAALAGAVSRPDLLLVGALLHDIGKGHPGDHTEVGVSMVGPMAERMGFPADDAEVLVDMVRHHLLLPDAATRRDLDDPRTAEVVAEAVGDELRLELLWALARSDGPATGPAAWSEWKEDLVADLVRRVERVLAGRPRPPRPGLAGEEAAMVAGGRLAVLARGATVTVVAPDQPGLLYRVAGVLALHGLTVRSARAESHGDMALERFHLVADPFVEPRWDAVETDLARALSGSLDIEAGLAARTAARRPGPRHPVDIKTRITWDNAAAGAATVVEVRTADAPGVLYRIARAIARLGLDVRTALVTTMGVEAVDAFYVSSPDAGKVTDAEMLDRLARELRSALDDR